MEESGELGVLETMETLTELGDELTLGDIDAHGPLVKNPCRGESRTHTLKQYLTDGLCCSLYKVLKSRISLQPCEAARMVIPTLCR